MKDHYGWTVNICINPVHWLLVIIWVGDVCYTWKIRVPLKIHRTEKPRF